MTVSHTAFLAFMFGPPIAVMTLLYLRIFYLSFKAQTDTETAPQPCLSANVSTDVISKLNTFDERTSERWVNGF